MRILLVDPPCHRFMGFHRHYFPLGLAHLAGELRTLRHEVLVYDAEHDPTTASSSVLEADEHYHFYLEALKDSTHGIWSEFVSILEDFKPHVVGFSTLSVKVSAVLLMARLTKEYDQDIIIVVGGDHATVRPQDFLKGDDIDLAVRGEGERILVNLVSCLENKGSRCTVPGISWKESGRVVSSGPMPLVTDLDRLAVPSFDSLYRKETYRPIDMGLMVTERGCPYACRFCGLSTIGGRKLRFHSIRRIVDEIILRKEQFGTGYFSFRNGSLTLVKERVVELCQEFKNLDLNITWECLTRVDCLDEFLLEKMIDSGCITVRIGIESGSDKILKYMGKGTTLSRIRTAAKLLNRSGIFWSSYFMLGVPEETASTMRETLELMQEIDPPYITIAKYTPIAGTPMYQDVVNAGLLDEDETDWTWSLNQTLKGVFVKHMDSQSFTDLFREIGAFVSEHNERKSKSKTDARLKF